MKHLEALLNAGAFEEAARTAHALLDADPHQAFAHQALGIIAHRAGRFDVAAEHFRQAIAGRLPGPHAWSNLGACLRASGHLAEAEEAFRTALAIAPGAATTLANHANLLYDLARYQDAERTAEAAISAGADHGAVHLTHGNALFRQGRLFPAMDAFRRALAADRNPVAAQNLASSLLHLGRFDEAVATYRSVLIARPDRQVHSSYLIALNYHPRLSAAQILAAHREYETIQCAGVSRRTSWSVQPDPARRIRIGYVSPDLCNHVVSAFVLPLIEGHDRRHFDVFCYANVPKPDETSARIQRVSTWVSTVGLPDDAVAARIVEDGIDVLVDLAGHSTANRLRVFAMKPAPVQLSYVIGTGTTTGLSAIDGLIADDVLLPSGEPLHIAEQPVRLGRPFVAYAPLPAMPAIGPLPSAGTGTVTFGYFGRLVRLNDDVIATWSDILRALPASRLRLDSPPLADPEVRANVHARFAACGIPEDRIELYASAGQHVVWGTYNRVDVALDPFPHNAGTTTLEALWMGVPVITLSGRPPVGRLGCTLLQAIDATDWVATDRADYVARAIRLAKRTDELAVIRTGLRDRVARSSLCDVAGWIAAMENAYRSCWQAWCCTQTTTST